MPTIDELVGPLNRSPGEVKKTLRRLRKLRLIKWNKTSDDYDLWLLPGETREQYTIRYHRTLNSDDSIVFVLVELTEETDSCSHEQLVEYMVDEVNWPLERIDRAIARLTERGILQDFFTLDHGQWSRKYLDS
jgi:hypothetical protein